MIYPLSFTSLSALVTDKKECQKFRMGSLISCFIPAAFLLSTAVQHMRKSSLVRPKVQLAEQQMLRETRYLEIYPSLEMHSWSWVTQEPPDGIYSDASFLLLEQLDSRWSLLFCDTMLSFLKSVNLHATSSSLSVIAWHALYAPDRWPVLLPRETDLLWDLG